MPLSVWTEELSAVESLLKTSLRSLLLSCPWPGSRARAPVRKKKEMKHGVLTFASLGYYLLLYFPPLSFTGLCSALYSTPFSELKKKVQEVQFTGIACMFHLFNGNAPGREIVCPNHGHGVECKSSGQWYRLLGLCLRGLEWRKKKLAFSQEIKTVNYESNNVDPNNSCSRDWTNAEFA